MLNFNPSVTVIPSYKGRLDHVINIQSRPGSAERGHHRRQKGEALQIGARLSGQRCNDGSSMHDKQPLDGGVTRRRRRLRCSMVKVRQSFAASLIYLFFVAGRKKMIDATCVQTGRTVHITPDHQNRLRKCN